jgi:inorganic pyrophosphatase
MRMAKLPTALPAFLDEDKGEVNVVIETPRGSRVKYAWDQEREIFVHKKLLPLGMVFPYDFGFIPSTKAEDGDPLDALVLLDEPLQVGTLVEARLIGVIEAEQTEPVEGKKNKTQTVRNDRLLAIGKLSKDYAGIDDPRNMRPESIEQIQQFFIQYSKLEGREFKVLDVRGPKRALKLLKHAINGGDDEEAEELKGAA